MSGGVIGQDLEVQKMTKDIDTLKRSGPCILVPACPAEDRLRLETDEVMSGGKATYFRFRVPFSYFPSRERDLQI